jgi:hypothetical protein
LSELSSLDAGAAITLSRSATSASKETRKEESGDESPHSKYGFSLFGDLRRVESLAVD